MIDAVPFRPLLRIVGNIGSLLTSDVLNRLTTFLLYALVGRHLDARSFGQLSLALALFYTFQVLASLGLPMPLTREIAKDRTRTASYFVTASFLALLGGLASIAALMVLVYVMGYAADTAEVVLLLGLGLIPFAQTVVCEAVFRAWERMHLIACANVPVNLVKIVAAYVFLKRGCTLHDVALLLVVSTGAVLLIEWGLMLWCIVRPRLRLDLAQAWSLARTSFTFLGIEGLIAVWSSVCIVILSKLGTETDVALFNAAGQLLVPPMLVTQSVMLGMFPLLCRQFQLAEDPSDLRRASRRLIEVLLSVVLPGSVALFYLAVPLLVWAFRNPEFAAAGILLQIMVPTVALRVLTATLGNALLAGHRERVTLRIVGVDLAFSLVLGIVLTYYYGVIGAAVGALLVRIIDFVQHYWSASRLLAKLNLVQISWKPVLASLMMAAALAATQSWNIFAALALATFAYVLALAATMIYSHGGIKHIRARFFPDMALEAAPGSRQETT